MLKNNTLTKKSLSDLEFCVIDTETTGGNAQLNRVIDVAVLHFKDGEIIDKFQSLVNPGRPIPFWITQLTGITNNMVKDAPSFSDIAKPLQKILSKGIFTAHNANFDYGFIREEFRRSGHDYDSPICCTLKLARLIYPDLPSKSLGALCESLLIDIWDRHRAFGDAEATVYVFKDLIQKAKVDHKIKTWGDLDAFSRFGRMSLPRGLSLKKIGGLPATGGTYVFKDRKGSVIFKGQTKDIRMRIHNLFRESNQSMRSNKYRELVHDIEVVNN